MTKKKEKIEEVAEEPLKDTDTLPSEAETGDEKQAPEDKKEKKHPKKKRIIGLMGIEHQVGPAGSSHG